MQSLILQLYLCTVGAFFPIAIVFFDFAGGIEGEWVERLVEQGDRRALLLNSPGIVNSAVERGYPAQYVYFLLGMYCVGYSCIVIGLTMRSGQKVAKVEQKRERKVD